MRTLKIIVPLILIAVSCVTTIKMDKGESDDILENNREFLKIDSKASETFRVLLSSDHYVVSQMKFNTTIKRVIDVGGDKYISDEIKKFNKINEKRDGLISIWLYPDSGNIMKVRPQRLTYLVEVDKLIGEDVQRWSFKFPKRIVYPTRFDIKYRIILSKTQSDDEIIKEIQDKMREERKE